MTVEEELPTPEDYRKEDIKKALLILLKSGIAATVVTIVLYYLPI